MSFSRYAKDEEYTAAASARKEKLALKEEKYRRSAGIIAVPEEEMDLGGGERRNVGDKIMAGAGGLR
jgi:hypothetical protein